MRCVWPKLILLSIWGVLTSQGAEAPGPTPAAVDLGEAVIRQAIREVAEYGTSYGLEGAVRLPWRGAGEPLPHTVGEWKCNFFVLNVVYLAGGRVPVVVYGSGLRRIVSNYMLWQGQRLTRQARRDVSESHYPCSGDLADPKLFVNTLPIVQGGLEALQKGDLIILHPPEGEREGHCLVYLGHRRGTLLQVACAGVEKASVEQYDVEGEREYTIRRPRGPPPAAPMPLSSFRARQAR